MQSNADSDQKFHVNKQFADSASHLADHVSLIVEILIDMKWVFLASLLGTSFKAEKISAHQLYSVVLSWDKPQQPDQAVY